MELLVLKSEGQYVCVKDGRYFLVGLDKASVFPVKRFSLVEEHMAAAKAAGCPEVRLKKLILVEKDYQP